MLEEEKLFHGNRGVIRKLRHRGKARRRRGIFETRGKIAINNRIHERLKEADGRQVIGHWEADTLAGKTGSACLVTIADRCSRYLLAGNVAKKYSTLVADKMIALLSVLPKRTQKSITPDRGKEFSRHAAVTAALDGLQFLLAVQKRLCKPPKSGKINLSLEVLLWQEKNAGTTASYGN